MSTLTSLVQIPKLKYRTWIKTSYWSGYIIIIIIFIIIFIKIFIYKINYGLILFNKMLFEGHDPFINIFNNSGDIEYLKYNIHSPSIYSDDNNLSLIIFAVADKLSSIGCDTLRLNTNIYNNSINYLGLGHYALNRKITHIYKLTNTFQQLKYLYFNNKYNNNNTIILFIDAFDVLIQSSSKQILLNFIKLENYKFNKYKNIWKYPKNIIYFSAETNCYPCFDGLYKNQYPFKNDKNIKNKYLNAGSWIARLENAYNFFKLMMKYEINHVSYETLHSDQYVMHRLFINLYKNNTKNIHILLDYNDIILKTTYDDTQKSINKLSYFYNIVKYYHNNGNNNYYNFSSTLHFNSPREKQKLKKILKYIKQNNKNNFYKNDKHKIINTNLGKVSLESLCSKSFQIHDPELIHYK